MSFFDSLLGRIFSRGSELELMGGLDFKAPLSATPNPATGLIDITAESSGLGVGSFGSGSDGPLTASSGVTTLTRDTYYTTIDLSGTAEINTAGFKLFATQWCKQVGSSKIHCNGAAGGNGGTGKSTGGAAGAAPPAGTTLDNSVSTGAGGAGGSGNSGTNGSASGGASADVTDGWGGKGGATGSDTQGGQGWFGNGSGGGTVGAVTSQHRLPQVLATELPRRIRAGSGGSGAGSGRCTNDIDGSSGSGGGGGGSAGVLWCVFAEYITDGTTQPGALSAIGGAGGDGGDAEVTSGTVLQGAGSGGGGGPGGAVYLVCGKRTGGPVTGLVDISGGGGGDGGDAAGTAASSLAAGGSGGGGGASGQAFAFDLATGAYALSVWANAATAVNPVTAQNPANLVGVAGTAATVTRLDF